MALLTRWGGIVGYTPATTGRFFFVAPAATYTIDGRACSASNDNDGLHPERALLTLSYALTKCSANVGDTIVLLDGTHTVTATVSVSTAGVRIFGMHSLNRAFNPYTPRTILTSTGTNIPLLGITANNIEIGYLGLRPTTGYSAVYFPTAVNLAVPESTTTLDNLYIHDFWIDLNTPAANRGTIGIDFGYRDTRTTAVGLSDQKQGCVATAITNVLIENGAIISGGAQGEGIVLATVYATVRNVHSYCRTGTWATAFRVATNADNILIDDCNFTSTATITTSIAGCLDSTTAQGVAGGTVIRRCTFGNFGTSNVNSVDAIRGFAAGQVQVIDCYAGSIANGTTSATAISRMIS